MQERERNEGEQNDEIELTLLELTQGLSESEQEAFLRGLKKGLEEIMPLWDILKSHAEDPVRSILFTTQIGMGEASFREQFLQQRAMGTSALWLQEQIYQGIIFGIRRDIDNIDRCN